MLSIGFVVFSLFAKYMYIDFGYLHVDDAVVTSTESVYMVHKSVKKITNFHLRNSFNVGAITRA